MDKLTYIESGVIHSRGLGVVNAGSSEISDKELMTLVLENISIADLNNSVM